jgi:hypothetical protein
MGEHRIAIRKLIRSYIRQYIADLIQFICFILSSIWIRITLHSLLWIIIVAVVQLIFVWCVVDIVEKLKLFLYFYKQAEHCPDTEIEDLYNLFIINKNFN